MELETAKYDEPRFLLFHLQPISARLHFLRNPSGSVLAPRSLPLLSSPIEEEAPTQKLTLNQQLEMGLKLNARLGFDAGMLVVEPEFRRRAEVPKAIVEVFLARFTTHEPPRELVRASQAEFCLITDLRGGHPVEMAMLRWAYEHLLVG